MPSPKLSPRGNDDANKSVQSQEPILCDIEEIQQISQQQVSPDTKSIPSILRNAQPQMKATSPDIRDGQALDNGHNQKAKTVDFQPNFNDKIMSQW